VRFPRAVSQTAPGRPRVTARPARRPVSAERGRLRQAAEGNARMRRVSGSAGLGLSRCPDASGAASTAVERRKASAPEAQTSGNIRWRGARRAPLGTANKYAPFGAPPPSFYWGVVGRAFLKRAANLGCQGASRERERVHPPPRKRGRGTTRSVVEGASDSTLRCRIRTIVEARAPPTALRAVPPPRYRGAGK
jgi:hypothetical protein